MNPWMLMPETCYSMRVVSAPTLLTLSERRQLT